MPYPVPGAGAPTENKSDKAHALKKSDSMVEFEGTGTQ